MAEGKRMNQWERLTESERRQCYEEYCYLMEMEWDSSKCLSYEEWCAESEEDGIPLGLEYDL